MKWKPMTGSQRRCCGEEGLSLLEIMIAMLLMAVIAIGILPLLMRSIADTNRSWEATAVSNFAQSRIEPMLAAPYESPPMAVASGANETITTVSWAEGDRHLVNDDDEGWTQDTTGKGRVFWIRNTYVRWYQADDLSTPVTGDTDPTEVSLKEIQVQLTGERRGGLGAGQELWIRVLKAF